MVYLVTLYHFYFRVRPFMTKKKRYYWWVRKHRPFVGVVPTIPMVIQISGKVKSSLTSYISYSLNKCTIKFQRRIFGSRYTPPQKIPLGAKTGRMNLGTINQYVIKTRLIIFSSTMVVGKLS